MKKILSLVLILVMCASLMCTALAADEAVKISVFKASSNPDNEMTDMIKQYIVDNIGVDVTVIQGDSANFEQQLALYITGNDMPVLTESKHPVWKEYAIEGAWADLTPYLNAEEYPSLFKYVGDAWGYATVEGKIYGIPDLTDHNTGHVVTIRKDWLAKLNLEVPVTLEDYTKVLRAFAKDDPDGNGLNDTYGVCGAGAQYLSFLMGAFGAVSNEYYLLNEDGTVTTNAISENYRNALRYLQGIYAEGLIDPEMFTCTGEQVQSKWGRGEMGILSDWRNTSYTSYTKYGFADLQPDADVDVILPPVGENGETGVLGRDLVIAMSGLSYKASPEEIKAALKFLDWQCTELGKRVYYYGVPGEFFEWDEATATTTWAYTANDNKTKSGMSVTGAMGLYGVLTGHGLELQNLYLTGMDSKEAKLNYNANMMCLGEEPFYSNLFSLLLTDEYVEYNAELTAIFNTNMLAFIMGEKNLDSDWDAYVKEYLSNGGETVRQSLLREYNTAFGTAYTFAE